jgi:hypothetical protein
VTSVPDADATACFVRAKHRLGDQAEGGVLYQDRLVYAGRVHTMGAGPHTGGTSWWSHDATSRGLAF